VKFVCWTANRRRSSSIASSVKRQRSKVEANEKTIKVDKDKIIQEEISATGRVRMTALFQTSCYFRFTKLMVSYCERLKNRS